MIGRVSGSGDRSFLCLVAIYAAHVLIFHVLEGTPMVVQWPGDLGARRPNSNNTSGVNDTAYGRSPIGAAATDPRPPPDLGPSSLLTEQLNHKPFLRSNKYDMEDPMALFMTYPKVNLDILFSVSFIHRMKNIFTAIALSSPTWGILSGCVIFLLTYTDRDNPLQT